MGLGPRVRGGDGQEAGMADGVVKQWWCCSVEIPAASAGMTEGARVWREMRAGMAGWERV